MTSPTSSKPLLGPTSRPFYGAPFQSTITAGTGWDKNLCRILHQKSPMPYSAFKEIASAYAELLSMLEISNGSLVGLHQHSNLKQILSTAEIFICFSEWDDEHSPLSLLNNINSFSYMGGAAVHSKFRHRYQTTSSKIETTISLLRDKMGLERQYKDFDNRRLLTFITCVSKILAEVSIALFTCMTLLAVVLPWHWKFFISKAGFALAIGAMAYLGFDASKRIQRYVLAVQNLYMHYFLFIWGWNDLKACLTHMAETENDVPLLDPEFLQTFQALFFGEKEELQRLQTQISVSLT
ncbi:hypothetical protein IW261DRAFT_1614917 [Armillaria novae-zelandiae]|uniref:Uncharacterized protein n=1 Tax=Armillaria novae-zelandiae TaxID=153914 RepID=A0AA39KHJ6_9AGAR|nr:hypothetical protein IW261DRAFT_1614917 [Armillaria novae-zelandiae]